MEFRPVTNEEFLSLAMLNALMYSSIDSNINEFQATNTLIHCINNGSNFKVLGAYNEGELVGFSHGKDFNSTMFEFTGLYMLPSFRGNVKDLINYSFALIKDLGYKGWEVDATNENISSIMEKYGASVKHTRYSKEFE